MSRPGQATELVRRLDQLGTNDRPEVGGKGASLGELIRTGIPVPPGFVVTTRGFLRALETLDPGAELRARIGQLPPDAAAADPTIRPLRDRILGAPLPDDVRDAIVAAYRELGADATPVAVRSSATAEDSAEASFAGLQDTYLWVRGAEDVVEHVRRCWASLYSLEAVSYRRQRGLGEDGLAMAVVVQEMVDARCSGVMFTCSPTTGDPSVIAIESGWGLGSAMVSGEVTPDALVVSKVTGEVVKREIAVKTHWHRMDPSGHGVVSEEVPEDLQARPCLSESQLTALTRLARRVEQHYGCPQDIEWAIPTDAGETDIVLLQSRPETVWANRPAQPVAAPKPRAFDHVLGVLGGQARHRGDDR
ncbi:PEP/pyruvate-binding domain-containing protein [Egicoccus sp. AB-alg2]|uniref:PEP/pyruvate-binding domain-containing protein n=1 Tax=Egicoccus sp. AB-alg2 TaxID=3242693 RepID=UPI00359D5710